MTSRMPRIGLAGVHGHGATHVRAARELERDGRAVLAAVADHRPPGPDLDDVTAYREASDMIAAEGLDVVVLCTPMHTHLPLAEQALLHGAHVLLEKPPTPTLDEFHRLLAASEATGRAVQLGFQSLKGICAWWKSFICPTLALEPMVWRKSIQWNWLPTTFALWT